MQDLLREEIHDDDNVESEVVSTILEVGGVRTEVIIDTGAEITIISEVMLHKIIAENTARIPTLPVTNVSFIGATGKKNQTIRKQVLLEISHENNSIPITFLVARDILFNVLIGCDTLQLLSTVIDLKQKIITFYYEGQIMKCNIIGRKEADKVEHVKTINRVIAKLFNKPVEYREEQLSEDELWHIKLKEIMNFQNKPNEIPLSSKQLLQLADIYNQFRHVFSEHPGKARNFQCCLEFKENVEFKRKTYPIAHSLKDKVRKEIQRMLDDDIIEPSNSPHTNPLLAIPKKDGSVRLCLDAREINRMLVNDRTSPDNIEEIMKRFHGLKYISSWDTVCGYWQVELHPRSRQYVAFIFEGRNYCFKRLPFGLINSVAVFVKCMDQILGKEVLEYTTVYVDDLLITSNTWEEHCQRVYTVLEKLDKNNITLKLNKSKFITDETEFLGFILTSQGIRASNEKIEAIQRFPVPKNIKHLQSFLGLCNYYRKFQKDYSQLTAQFQKQLSNKNKWNWGIAEDEVFNTIKKKFLEKVMLNHPDFNKRFYLNCDASDIGLGVELYQEDERGDHLVISFASRTLNKCERHYSVTEKELLSIVFACTKLRTYLLGYPVTIRSDHKSISYLKRCKLGHGRITRWVLTLQEYDISWEYIPGRENVVADTLSRINITRQTFETEPTHIIKIFSILKDKKDLEIIMCDIALKQSTDEKINLIKEKLQYGDETINMWYMVYNDILFKKVETHCKTRWKVVIPHSLVKEVIWDYHERYGHMGAEKVIQALKEHVYIKGINKAVKNTIKCCELCQKTKVANVRREGEMIAIMSEKKLEKLFIDICGPFPKSGGVRQWKYVLIIIDSFTKYIKLYPLNRANTKNVLKVIIHQYLIEVGTPVVIISDHGTQFKGKLWKNELLKHNIKTYKTSIYHPSSNLAERALREVGRILRTYCHNDHKTWSKYLKFTEESINFSYHDSIGTTPYNAMHNAPTPRLITKFIPFPDQTDDSNHIMDIHSRLLYKAAMRKKRQDKTKFVATPYQEGDLVLLKNHQVASTSDSITKKLLLIYIGPYVVAKNNLNNTYLIKHVESNKVKGTYNYNQLKPYYSRPK